MALKARLTDSITKIKEFITGLRERHGWLDHLINTVLRYNDQQGNTFAAGLTFRSVLALVPVIMVAFATAGFVLASQPQLLSSLQSAILRSAPGEMGKQLSDIIDSAIESRTTVGVVGLLGAAFTGLGWMSALRMAMTQMWGGKVERNAVLSKLSDLGIFVLLGIAFAATAVISAAAGGGVLSHVLSWFHLSDEGWAPYVIQVVSIVVSLAVSTLLFAFVLSKIPLVDLPYRRAIAAGLTTAVVFEILKAVGGIYFRSVVSSPAGVAFGPILGLMVLAYLASRIILYATAWCATATVNTEFQIGDHEDCPRQPVTLEPVYEVSAVPSPKALVGAAGVGAVLGYLTARRRD